MLKDKRFYPNNATEVYYTFTCLAKYIDWIELDGQTLNGYRIDHRGLVNAKRLVFYMK